MDFGNNKEIELAYDFVFNTNKNIFLTGKAGTGKTTFLRNIRTSIPKRMVVVAPTGVAAINAGGVTIHSFFQLPFSPYVPKRSGFQVGEEIENLDANTSVFGRNKLNRNKIKIIKSLDLLIIDEISMVRADLLDAIDEILRTYRRNSKPFGGVQLLMIGDLYQLAPVIKDEEWELIRDYYKTYYFFGSNALQSSEFITIELKHIYRQSDREFIDLLGEIRENKLTEKSISILNKRYIQGFSPNDKEGYITLTTHNATANSINESHLTKIEDKAVSLKAKIYDEFPEYMYPTEEVITLKVGAQVMFVKNDSSFDKLYYNGKIGKITRIEDDIVYVKCPEDYSEIPAKPEIWYNVKYSLNENNKEIEESVIGRFDQYPLKLAWAITIHKSQGLTFDKAVIDINAAFAFGQVYVALSRCRTLDGLVLMSEISPLALKTDYTIREFNNEASANSPDDKILSKSRFHYQKELIIEQFDFTQIRKQFYYIRKIINENSGRFDNSLSELINDIEIEAKKNIFEINDKFIQQIYYLIKDDILPQENDMLQDRIKKASAYYSGKIDDIFINKLRDISFDVDNKELKKNISEAVERFERSLYVKNKSLSVSLLGFETQEYLRAVADADMDFVSKFNKRSARTASSKSIGENYDLYAEINAWRKIIAEESDIPLYMVLPQKTLKELVEKLPSDLKQLSKIKGFGKVKVQQFGEDILEIIDNYCSRNNIKRDETEIEELKTKKVSKPDTKLLSFELLKQGKTIEEIAVERGLVDSTVYSHLGYYISKGELEITELLPSVKVEEITEYLYEKGKISLRQLYEDADRKYTYQELKLVISYLEKNN